MVKTICYSSRNLHICTTLREIKGASKAWVKEHRAKDKESILSLEEKISAMEEVALSNSGSQVVWAEVKALREELWKRYRIEERERLQKLRLKFFKEGDRNSKFFHTMESLRSKVNHISCIRVDNVSLSDSKQIIEAIETHFRRCYNEVGTISVTDMKVKLHKLAPNSVSSLEAPFTEDEVWLAIKSADGTRAPGLDGFNLDFFKKFWDQLKTSIMDFFSNFFKGRLVDKSINHPFITLIPKNSCPQVIDDFRPISLVGSLCKVLPRVLSRRLAGCIEEMVSKRQFTFIAGKQIVDCSLIVNEIIDEQKRKKRKASVFKADFKKAYDSVDWCFLDLIMDKMGFGKRWRNWIKMCLSTTTISVLVNGSL